MSPWNIDRLGQTVRLGQTARLEHTEYGIRGVTV